MAVAPPELGEDATIIINKAAHGCGFDGDLEPGALEAEGDESQQAAGGHGEFGDSPAFVFIGGRIGPYSCLWADDCLGASFLLVGCGSCGDAQLDVPRR